MGIADYFREFFVKRGVGRDFAVDSLLVLRRDGQMVYRYPEDKDEASSAGVLMGGAWQAARALVHLIEESQGEENFRLSFDTTDTGLYMLPFCGPRGETYYMGALYRECLNGAKLKNRLRMLRDDLERYLEGVAPLRGEEKTVSFDHITDEEIDGLFSPMGC